MVISLNQVDNILKNYQRQLKLGKEADSTNNIVPNGIDDKVTISTEARKKQIVEQVATRLIKQITSEAPTQTSSYASP